MHSCIQYSTNLHVMRSDTNCCFSLLINKGKPFTAILKRIILVQPGPFLCILNSYFFTRVNHCVPYLGSTNIEHFNRRKFQ